MNSDLDKFIKAQEENYKMAISEIKNGYKRNHWMWYIFPQLKGLGMSKMANYYGIKDLEEAKAYLNNQYLKSNLIEISNALLSLNSCNATEILGYPDDLKLKSCMTLFNYANPTIEVFSKVLDKFFNGQKDIKTLELLWYEK